MAKKVGYQWDPDKGQYVDAPEYDDGDQVGILNGPAPEPDRYTESLNDDMLPAIDHPLAPSPGTASGQPSTLSQNEQWNEHSRQDPTFNPRDALWDSQKGMFEDRLRSEAGNIGWNNYDMGELQDVERWVRSADHSGQDASPALTAAIAKIKARGANNNGPVTTQQAPRAGITSTVVSGERGGARNSGARSRLDAYLAAHPSKRAEAERFLQGNPEDEDRIFSAMGWDPNAPPDGTSPPASPVQAAYSQYLTSPVAAPATTTSGQAQTANPLLQQLVEQISSERARQEQERETMRRMLRERITDAGTPVSPNDPGIREIIAAQRLAGQRTAERERSQTAARLAADNLSDSGAADTALFGVEQARGEQEQAGIADVMGRALERKSQELRSLLNLAVQSGDAEAARTLQAQLAAIEGNLAQQRITNQAGQFGQDLDFRQNSFLDNLGLSLLRLQMLGNQDAFNAFM